MTTTNVPVVTSATTMQFLYITNNYTNFGASTNIYITVSPYSTNVLTTNVTTSPVIRQVIAPQSIADIPVPPTTNGYIVALYYPSQVAGTNLDGTRTFSGSPSIVWTVTNPSPSSINQLVVSETNIQYSASKQWTYSCDGNGNWSVQTLGSIQETMIQTNLSSSAYQITDITQFASGPVAQQRSTTYTTYAYSTCTNSAVSQTVVGTGSAAQVTSYTYWDPAYFSAGAAVLVKTVSNPDGSWQDYNSYDSSGRPLQVYSSYGDVPVSSMTSARETDYTYDPVAAGVSSTGDNGTIFSNVARLTIKKINGVEVSRSYTVFPSLALRLDFQCTVPGAATNTAGNLVTTNIFYTTGPNQGMLEAVVRPDGTMTTYDYATNSAGTDETNITATGQPDTSFSHVVDGTSNVTVVNMYGYTVSATSYDVVTGIILSQDTYSGFTNSGSGPPTEVTHLDGTTEYTSYSCCGIDTTVDKDSVSDQYLYDSDHRLIGLLTLYGSVALERTNALDPVGQVLEAVRIGSDSTTNILSQWAYDTAGELVSQVNALGGTNTYTRTTNVTTGGLIRTTNNPDGGTVTNFYYADGTLKETFGTATAGQAYSYGTGTDFNGDQCTTVTTTNLNANGSLSSQWTETFTDMAGRTTEILYAAASGSPMQQFYYNSLGQLIKRVDPDGVTTLYGYDAKGVQTYHVVDINQNGIIDLGGPDRVTFSTNYVTSAHSTNVLRTDTYVWDGSSTNGSLLSRSEISTSGLQQWNTIWGSGSAVTSSNQTAYSGGGNRSVTNMASDNSYSVSAYVYGRLASTTKYDSTGTQIGRTTNGYDAHGRQNTVYDARNGTTTMTFTNDDQISTVTTPSPNEVTTSYYDTSERLIGQKLPDGTYTTNILNPSGQTGLAYGSREYPVGNGYDGQQRMTTMTNWTSFLTGLGSRVTTWNYDQYRGWLNSKIYANSNGTSYGYSVAGRLASRLWARGTNTSYTYYTNSGSASGDLAAVNYNDGLTSALGYGYDRLSHKTIITNSSTLTTLVYNDPGLLLIETNSGGPLGGWSITNGYDGFMRRTKTVVLSNSTPVWTVNYTYDNASRLATVSDGTNTAAYSYLANSSLVGQIGFSHSGVTNMVTTKGYDNLNRLTGVTNVNASSVVLDSHGYDYNLANQRTSMTDADGSYWIYGYDSLGQVTSAVKYWSDGKAAAGEQFGGQFDDIGNRITSQMGGNENGVGLRTANYTANSLNQYTSRTVPGAVDVVGSATNTSTVNVNGVLAYRHGSYYRAELPINNAAGAVWQSVTNMGVLGGSPNTNANVTGSLFLPQNPETFTYDKDGNLTSDGRFTNTWNAENRLIGMTNIANIAAAGQYGLSFTYDYIGRRIQKVVYTNSGGVWEPAYTNKFIYDGWNVVAILDGFNNLISSFAWGKDLSGSMQGAGGVSGLISMTVYGGMNAGTFFYCYDGNGNVVDLINAANGSIAAQYEYGPFGELIRATGFLAFANPFLFSTKFYDWETGTLNYPLRPYNPLIGRFLIRDPLGEESFLIAQVRRDRTHAPELCRESLKSGYVLVSNEAVNDIDPVGLDVYKVTSSSLVGVPLHRQIVGDDGNGGYYVLEFFGHSCRWSVGCHGYYLIGRGNVQVSRGQGSAADYIKAQDDSIVTTVETSDVYFWPSNESVDSELSNDVNNYFVNGAGAYIFLFNDCGSIANTWIKHAKEVLRQAEDSAPGGGPFDPFSGLGF